MLVKNLRQNEVEKSDVDQFLGEYDYSKNTQDRYHHILDLFIQENKAIETMTPIKFKDWLYRDTWGDSICWSAFCSVRKFLIWKYGNKHPAIVFKLRRRDPGPQRTMDEWNVMRLISWFDQSPDAPIAIRDRALAALLLDTALRSSEICRLDFEKVDLRSRRLSVIVKWVEWAEAVFCIRTELYVREWTEIRKKIVSPGERALFIGIGGSTHGKRITRHGLQIIVRHWGQRADIGPLSPHDFRRTFATLSTRRGAPERITMKAGRWKNPIVFGRYFRALSLEDFEPYFPMKLIGELDSDVP